MALRPLRLRLPRLTALPSVTATTVAAARALAALGRQVDPGPDLALLPCSSRLRAALARLRPQHARALCLAGLGVVEHVARRSAAIDAFLAEATGAGVRQVVLLGVGLDTRPWRLELLASARLWEVDRGQVLAWRSARLGARPVLAEARIAVAAELGREDLAGLLAAAGHSPDHPTAWVAEGLSMYLPRPALLAALDQVRIASAGGSRLALSYVEPEIWPLPAGGLARAAFGLIGEPLLSTFAPAELAGVLLAAGFRVERDTGQGEWPASPGLAARRAWLFQRERLAIARVDGQVPRER